MAGRQLQYLKNCLEKETNQQLGLQNLASVIHRIKHMCCYGYIFVFSLTFLLSDSALLCFFVHLSAWGRQELGQFHVVISNAFVMMDKGW